MHRRLVFVVALCLAAALGAPSVVSRATRHGVEGGHRDLRRQSAQ